MILNKNSLQIASGTINLVMGLALAATGLNICFSSWQYAAANKIFFFLFEQLIPAEVSYEGFKNIFDNLRTFHRRSRFCAAVFCNRHDCFRIQNGAKG